MPEHPFALVYYNRNEEEADQVVSFADDYDMHSYELDVSADELWYSRCDLMELQSQMVRHLREGIDSSKVERGLERFTEAGRQRRRDAIRRAQRALHETTSLSELASRLSVITQPCQRLAQSRAQEDHEEVLLDTQVKEEGYIQRQRSCKEVLNVSCTEEELECDTHLDCCYEYEDDESQLCCFTTTNEAPRLEEEEQRVTPKLSLLSQTAAMAGVDYDDDDDDDDDSLTSQRKHFDERRSCSSRKSNKESRRCIRRSHFQRQTASRSLLEPTFAMATKICSSPEFEAFRKRTGNTSTSLSASPDVAIFRKQTTPSSPARRL